MFYQVEETLSDCHSCSFCSKMYATKIGIGVLQLNLSANNRATVIYCVLYLCIFLLSMTKAQEQKANSSLACYSVSLDKEPEF